MDLILKQQNTSKENIKKEKDKSEEIERLYTKLNSEFSVSETKKIKCIEEQKNLTEKIKRTNDTIDELKKDVINS